MFRGRLQTAKALRNTIKIKKIIKVSKLKQEFSVMSAISGRVTYKVTICNVPTCTCPYFFKKRHAGIMQAYHMRISLRHKN